LYQRDAAVSLPLVGGLTSVVVNASGAPGSGTLLIDNVALTSGAPGRKISLVEDANRTARRLALAGIELRFPGVSPEERLRLLMDVVLGEELAARLYGPRRATPGR